MYGPVFHIQHTMKVLYFIICFLSSIVQVFTTRREFPPHDKKRLNSLKPDTRQHNRPCSKIRFLPQRKHESAHYNIS